MQELAMVVDLTRQVGIILFGRLEYDLQGNVSDGCISLFSSLGLSCLGAICQLVGREVDLAKRSFSYQAPDRVVSDRSKVLGIELAGD